jgi:3-hydroxybutyryl-CoA dehydrogenase
MISLDAETANRAPRPIRCVAVIGTGQMGPGIAHSCAQAGYSVCVLARSQTSVDRARARVRSDLEAMLPYGLVRPDEIEAAIGRIAYRMDGLTGAADADLVIEGITEDLALKQKLFAELEDICRADAIIMSTTSGLRCTDIAALMARPERAIVGHYWNPPHLLPLVEVAPGERTAAKVTDAVFAFLHSTGHAPVFTHKEVVGFVANRLQHALWREAFALVERGIASPDEVDEALKTSFGARTPVLGIFEHADLVGLDLVRTLHSYLLADLDAQTGPNAVLTERVRRGDLGVKTGKGFYDWSRKSAADVLKARDTELLERAAKRRHSRA